MDNIKLVLKLRTPKYPEPRWIHMCYIDRTLHNAYTAQVHHVNNESLSKWCKEDFGVDMEVKTDADLNKLKDMVKDLYSEKYPELYYESTTDHQGWFRIWVQNKMKEELDGKVSK